MGLETLGYAFVGGFLPSLIWLYFLLKEDSRCPEPPAMIALAFVAGMIAVPLVLPLEQYAISRLSTGLPVLTAWAVIEETMKYIVAAVFIFWRNWVDEAPDYVLYLITIALGFAAAENTLFLVSPIASGGLATGLLTDNLRFMGSTLLHVVASSAIGFGLAFSYTKRPVIRAGFAALGLVLAVALHVVFNALIISEGGGRALLAFFFVWTFAVVFFAIYEVLKYIRYRNLPKNTC